MVYDEGIYSIAQEASWVKNNSKRPEWTKVDHSVLLYGWGQEVIDGKIVKFWML